MRNGDLPEFPQDFFVSQPPGLKTPVLPQLHLSVNMGSECGCTPNLPLSECLYRLVQQVHFLFEETDLARGSRLSMVTQPLSGTEKARIFYTLPPLWGQLQGLRKIS